MTEAMPELILLAEMDRLGFVLIPARPGFAFEWRHPRTGPRCYVLRRGGNPADALQRFRMELKGTVDA